MKCKNINKQPHANFLCFKNYSLKSMLEWHGNMYNIIQETNRQSRFNTGSLGLVHRDDPEGWCGKGGERGVHDGEHVYARGRFMLMCGRTNTVL